MDEISCYQETYATSNIGHAIEGWYRLCATVYVISVNPEVRADREQDFEMQGL